ncbi:acrB/AcrD/AcrF family protein, partial [Vibrio parahaemolyticus 861]
NREPILPWR